MPSTTAMNMSAPCLHERLTALMTLSRSSDWKKPAMMVASSSSIFLKGIILFALI
jgi:hypothetical protein